MSKLFFMCGKMAAGKSTLARRLARAHGAVLLAEDALLDALYPGEILEIADYVRLSSRLKSALAPHVVALLRVNVPVVLDFPGNTPRQRAWFREIVEAAAVPHELHFIDVPDALCKRQLAERSKGLAPGTPWTSQAEFDAVTAFFEPPSEEERFNVVRHDRNGGDEPASAAGRISPGGNMQTYVIERTVPGIGGASEGDLQGISQKSCGVLQNLGPDIEWLHSYVTGDKIYCVYRAANEEIVREHARQGGFPADSVSAVVATISPKTAG